MEFTDALTEKIFQHFQVKAHRSYPLLLTKPQIRKELEALENDPHASYIQDNAEGDIRGICGYVVDPSSKYLQTTLFVSLDRNPTFIADALDHLIAHYPDLAIHVGVEADNQLVIDGLQARHFRVDDDAYSTTIAPMTADVRSHPHVASVTLSQWQAYRDIHDRAFSDGYWTHEKIEQHFDDWRIFGIRDGAHIRAYLIMKSPPDHPASEIFGIYGKDLHDRICLIEHAVAASREKKILYYFTDDVEEVDACRALGFDVRGHYLDWVLEPV
jgi:hypothetical protein